MRTGVSPILGNPHLMACILRVFVWILGKPWKVNGFRICSIMAHIFFRHILYPELFVTSQNILLKYNKTQWNQTESQKMAFYPSKSKKNLNFMPSSPLKFQQIPLLLGSFNPSEIWWTSSVGIMKFPTEWNTKVMFQATRLNTNPTNSS